MTSFVITLIGRAAVTFPLTAAVLITLRHLRKKTSPSAAKFILLCTFVPLLAYVPSMHLPSEISVNPLTDTVSAASLPLSVTENAVTPCIAGDGLLSGIISAVWLIGTAVYILRVTVGYPAYLRTVRRYSVSSRRIGRLRIVYCRDLPGLIPSAYGILLPTVVMPCEYCGESTRRMLRHELAHIGYGDIPLRMLVSLLCAVYWFNPLIHTVKRALYETSEMVCDVYALRGSDFDGRVNYSRQLICRSRRFPVSKRISSGAAFAHNEKRNKNTMKERLDEIMKENRTVNKKRRLTVILTAVLLIIAALFTMSMAYSVKDVTLGDAAITIPGYWSVKKVGDNKLEFGFAGDVAGCMIKLDTDEEYAAWHTSLDSIQLLAPIKDAPYSWAKIFVKTDGGYMDEGWFYNFSRSYLGTESRYIFVGYDILGHTQASATAIAQTVKP
nr:M56 family metallopeptidase [Clostridia bacterium]